MASPRILVVEDEQVVAVDIESQLTQLGYDVVGVASSGEEAVRLAKEKSPDLVLMDIQLHGSTDGIAAAAQIRRRSQVPVIFVTAHANSEFIDRATKAGPFDYVTKPYSSNDLNATVALALQQNRGTKKPAIVIAEDDAVIREGCLFPLLESDFEIVASVDDGDAAVAAAELHKPDVVLLDVSLPGMRGFDAARKILSGNPHIKVLFVSNYTEKSYLDEAMRMGAGGYVLKNRAVHELVMAIKTALSGQFYSGL